MRKSKRRGGSDTDSDVEIIGEENADTRDLHAKRNGQIMDVDLSEIDDLKNRLSEVNRYNRMTKRRNAKTKRRNVKTKRRNAKKYYPCMKIKHPRPPRRSSARRALREMH